MTGAMDTISLPWNLANLSISSASLSTKLARDRDKTCHDMSSNGTGIQGFKRWTEEMDISSFFLATQRRVCGR